MNRPFEMSSLIGRLSGARVVVVGDIMLDRFVEGEVDRISPEAPIPVFAVTHETTMLGGAGNVLRNLATLGTACTIVAAVGDDPAGGEVEAMVAAAPGADSRLLAVAGRRTTIKTRYVAAGQQMLRADRETVAELAAADGEAILDSATVALADAAVLLLSDYGKGVLGEDLITRLIAAAKAADRPVIVDPKGDDNGCYRGARLVTPNRQELALASGMPVGTDAEVEAACRRVIETAGIGAVLATRSEQGMTLVDGDTVHHFPARAQAVFDVSGAGDTVAAALAAALAAGSDLADAARFANAAAGIVVAKVGTAVAHPAELLAAAHESDFLAAETKVETRDGAVERVAAWRRGKLRIGFTNGVFDLLHPGHVALLRQARTYCDRLVVGLNSDGSVRRLKGEDRPVQNEASRAAVLASLADVDMVVVFDEDTPLSLIEILKPAVLVKGADYTRDQVVGASEVESWGGEVVLADIVDGHSTTEMIRRTGA